MTGSGPNGSWLSDEHAMGTMLPVTRWRVYYSSSVVEGDSVTAWEHAPREGVQAVVYLHDGSRGTYSDGIDEYHLPGAQTSKLGLMIDLADYELVAQAARAWLRVQIGGLDRG